MRKKALAILMSAAMTVSVIGCASWSRAVTDIRSDIGGGLNRTITVYTANGDVLATYEGKIDIETNDGGYVKFDFNGKRYIYYNCFVESIANIE